MSTFGLEAARAALAELLAALDAGTSGGPPKVRRVVASKDLDDCRGAVQWIRANDEDSDVTETYVAPQKELDVRFQERDGEVIATVQVLFKMDRQRSFTRVTKPRWPKMTEAERKAVEAYSTAMQEHEDGHVRVADDVYRAASRSVEAHGADKAAAVEALKQELKRHLEETQEAAATATRDYDARTDHGRKQSAIGGKDVYLQCPG